MIQLLNGYYVPVTSSNQYPAEKPERQRIYYEALSRKLPVGDVNVYLLAPGGHVIETLDISHALKVDDMIATLHRVAAQLHTEAGPPVVKPHTESLPPPGSPDALVLHIVARGPGSGAWRQFPSENWVTLTPVEAAALLPPGHAALHQSWEVPPAVAARFLEWFYPPSEDPEIVNRSHIDRESLRMTVITLENGMARARIQGNLDMRHEFNEFTHAPGRVKATLVGFMDFDPAARRIQRLRLVTGRGDYQAPWGADEFSVAMSSVSGATLAALRGN